jgi:DNA-binding MarR family transcriptional regulator
MDDPDTLGVRDSLVQTSFLIQGVIERRAAERGVSLIQTRLLGVLRDREPTINELSVLLGLDKSSVSGLVDRAERRGLVARRPSQTDRRSVRVLLSPEGRAMVDAVGAALDADLVTLLAPLGVAERSRLAALLSRVLIQHADRRGIDLLSTRD